MLNVFYLNIVYVCKGFQVFSGVFFKCFKSMLQVCVLNVSVLFKHMLQGFYLNVACVAVVTHICYSICSKYFISFRRMFQ
jgi:uncharacterized membrane protein (DUF106 family)